MQQINVSFIFNWFESSCLLLYCVFERVCAFCLFLTLRERFHQSRCGIISLSRLPSERRCPSSIQSPLWQPETFSNAITFFDKSQDFFGGPTLIVSATCFGLSLSFLCSNSLTPTRLLQKQQHHSSSTHLWYCSGSDCSYIWRKLSIINGSCSAGTFRSRIRPPGCCSVSDLYLFIYFAVTLKT